MIDSTSLRGVDKAQLLQRFSELVVTDKPRASRKRTPKRNRAIPASVPRKVFARDEGKCTFVDERGRRCGSNWQVELHHRHSYARGGSHDTDNIALRCRAHNQYEAELDFGETFMAQRRHGSG